MHEEMLVYLLVVFSIVISLAGGGFLISAIAIGLVFYLTDRVKRVNQKAARRTMLASAVAVAVLAFSFIASFL